MGREKKARIKVSLWKNKYPEGQFTQSWDGSKKIVREIRGGFKTSSEHGRAQAKILCPFCEYWEEVYIWSLAGGGKICQTCGVLLTSGSAFAEENKVFDEEINFTKIEHR